MPIVSGPRPVSREGEELDARDEGEETVRYWKCNGVVGLENAMSSTGRGEGVAGWNTCGGGTCKSA